MQQQQQQHGGQLQESVSMPPGVGVTSSLNQLGQCRGPMHRGTSGPSACHAATWSAAGLVILGRTLHH